MVLETRYFPIGSWSGKKGLLLQLSLPFIVDVMDFCRPFQIFFTDTVFADEQIDKGANKGHTENHGEPCKRDPDGPTSHDDTDRKADYDGPVSNKYQGSR